MLRRCYNWVLELSAHRHAMYYLAAISFAESSFFPIPPDPMILAMSLANRSKAFTIAWVATISSVAGGFLGYFIGYALFETVGTSIIQSLSSMSAFESVRETFDQWSFWVIALKGLTPIPYKIVTIASGFSHIDLATFFGASVIARGGRFFFLAWLLRKYGDPIRDFVETRLNLVFFLGLGALVLGYFIVKLI